MSPEKEYLKWRQSPRVGCLYARLIAGKPSRFGQVVSLVSSADAPERVATRIAEAVTSAIANQDASAVLLLFPELNSIDDLVRVMLSLSNEPDWTVRPIPVTPPPRGFVGLNISRLIPFAGQSCPSEALVLGDFPEFPPTRRAPITALELFVGEPRPLGPLDDAATTKANLAHMELRLPTHDMFLSMWDGSHAGRARELGDEGNDNRAKAKVSLAIPSALANRLGCSP